MNLTFHSILAKLLSRLKFASIGYSQEGEDILIDRLLENKREGVFVDVGAHHPYHLSNTYRFYLRGWRGLNIDAMPGSMKAFRKIRPHDVNIEIPVSDKEETLTYYIFNDPALNTFSEEEARKKNGLHNYRIIKTEVLETKTLDYIITNYLKPRKHIDFMSVDAEGLDLKVLRSNNWEKFRPTLVLAEALNKEDNFENVLSDEICLFMKQVGYGLCAKTLNTLFFRDKLSRL